jgi:gamma-glutamyl AIG2-like cyclotransferase
LVALTVAAEESARELTEPMPMKPELLFSYGTLQLEQVQLANFGRRLTGTKDVLPGFASVLIEISDEATVRLSGRSHHAIARYTGLDSDTIPGMVFELTPDELLAADKYEVAEYIRAPVVLESGKRAWAYVDAQVPTPDV